MVLPEHIYWVQTKVLFLYIGSYVFRLKYSRHQADSRNKKEMFTAEWGFDISNCTNVLLYNI